MEKVLVELKAARYEVDGLRKELGPACDEHEVTKGRLSRRSLVRTPRPRVLTQFPGPGTSTLMSAEVCIPKRIRL